MNRRTFLKGLAAGVTATVVAPALVADAIIPDPKLPGSPFVPVGAIQGRYDETGITHVVNSPQGWLPCDGRVLPTALYPELYDAIGTSFGGNARRFRVPDLRGYTHPPATQFRYAA